VEAAVARPVAHACNVAQAPVAHKDNEEGSEEGNEEGNGESKEEDNEERGDEDNEEGSEEDHEEGNEEGNEESEEGDSEGEEPPKLPEAPSVLSRAFFLERYGFKDNGVLAKSPWKVEG